MELMPEEFDLQLDMNEKVDLLYSILLSGQFDLRVILFLICQLINKKILEENSKEINVINNIFDFMINKEYKFMINFILTIYKSLEKYLNDLIDEYVSNNFPENYNFSKKEYIKFLDFFKISKIIDDNEEGKEIQKIYYNWNLIKSHLEKTGVLFKFLCNAEEINYPKSVMNLIEKYIFDITREKNLHRFTNEEFPETENHKILNYIKLYYKAYSHIDDNNIILDNYFNNNQLFSLINKNNAINKHNYIINKDNYNPITLYDFISNINKFLINLDKNILFDNIKLLGEIEEVQNKNNMYLIVSRILYNIILLNETEMDVNWKKFYFSMLKNMEHNTILRILSFNNKLYEENNSINYSLLLYEISLYLQQFETLFKTNDSLQFNNDNKLLLNNLKNIFINKRKIPHLKRHLLVFQFRRFLFNLYNDPISELDCLIDIIKVYKTIWETGISNEEICNFRKYIHICINLLNNIDLNILLNVSKKYFLVPLKYYVKYFAVEEFNQFDIAYNKYQNLCAKRIKDTDFYSHKIFILPYKRKGKKQVIGLDKLLIDKCKTLKKKNSQNNQEGLILFTDYYLDRLIVDEKNFSNIRSSPNITRLQISEISPEVFEYLEGAIKICGLTEKEKFLRKYMPEIINLFFKLNFANANFNENNECTDNSQNLSQTKAGENSKIFKHLLETFKKDISINKVKIIIPQLIICYQYENTLLYTFAIELLTLYAEKNIDLIAYLLSSFLSFKVDTLKSLGIKPHRAGNDNHNNRYRNYISTFTRSKNFVSKIKNNLSQKNQNILKGYEDFSEKLSDLFIESKRLSNLSNTSKRDIRAKQSPFIKEINIILAKNKIILPTIENINNYKSEIRNNNNNNIENNVLFLKELDTRIETLTSKEKPMHIRFKTTNITGDLNTNNYYDFLLKCDVNDITKEIKTFEIIDEINNIFKIKHFDINDSMSLKRYLIVPIAPTIILAEWLSNSISLSSVIEEQSKKDLIYQEENKSIILFNNSDRPIIKRGSIINEEEKFNILYNYYYYNFFDPNLWYSAKRKYIVSTAIWSMASFLVGLGDRHPGNIMINKMNGEIIHIDFGYVALKGLSLTYPEIVDFRFTINLRKNLGLFEENGIFNYICVKTLKTFKEYYKTLSARIEYYQFDPLFDSENDNNTFTLFNQNDNFFKLLDDKNVKDKLKELVTKNSNGENLEKMYIWWSPWI
jgi:hypothetical protein